MKVLFYHYYNAEDPPMVLDLQELVESMPKQVYMDALYRNLLNPIYYDPDDLDGIDLTLLRLDRGGGKVVASPGASSIVEKLEKMAEQCRVTDP